MVADGALDEKTKQLVAVAVAHVTQCPYCIPGHTKATLRKGADERELNEAIWVATEMRAGGAYAHSNPLSSERNPMAHRVLVVTNEDLADANEVPRSIRPLVDDADEIYVVAPALTTWMQWLTDERDRAVVSADERLRTVFAHMHAGGLQAHGEVGAENQLAAIADALADFDADLIVLRLHAPGTEHENWREHRIAEKVRSHFDVPTTVFYFDPEGHVVQRENA